MSYSVPTSPAMSRSTKAQPVTPQRHTRQHPRSQSFHRSPLTPSASPYTPISLRSFDSTGSSVLTTPDNIGINVRKRLAFSVASPEVVRNTSSSKDGSLADIAENWRSRANENGIKVSFASQDGSHYVADESSDMSMSDVANDSSILSTEEALHEAPFMSTHRRLNSLPIITNRPRAQSHASLPPSRVQPSSPINTRNAHRASQLSSPAQPRRTLASLNHSANLMSTPPPNRALARQLKMKGSMTDPAQPRRREALGNVSISSHNIGHKNASMSLTLEPDTSLDLFDIDENDFEYEHEYEGLDIENSFSRELQSRNTTSNGFGYPAFGPHQGQQQSYAQQPFADPFHNVGTFNGLHSGHILHNIAESVEHHFHAARQQPLQKPYFDDMHQVGHTFYNPVATRLPPHFSQGMPQAYPAPTFVPIPHTSHISQPATPVALRPVPEQSFSNSSFRGLAPIPGATVNPTDCSVCLASHPTTLAILQPCKHPLCSGCLTSALNIVGEKDMECAVCKQSVADFKLVMGSSKGDASAKAKSSDAVHDSGYAAAITGSSATNFFSSGSSHPFDHESANESSGDLESAFEFGLDFGELRASTPKMEQQANHSTEVRAQVFGSMHGSQRGHKAEDNAVLRIDNVPWDITPTQISKWLQQPVERVHVLLDGRGKTLSHAYVEVKTPAIAGAILRGEAISTAGKKERGSVLGRGRRARGVTITRSGQQELMADLFPYWRGSFDGSRPSLAGLEGERIIGALEGGLLTENEVSGLIYLIREPDSHFLKVPSLPFHSLISLLSKFPTDVDSRVFWSSGVRDALFDATNIAIQNLLARVDKAKENASKSLHDEEYTLDLVVDLLHTALNCNAFTNQHIRRLMDLAEARSLPLPQTAEISDIASFSGSSAPRTPSSAKNTTLASSDQASKRSQVTTSTSLDDLAKEFGVDAHVVQALAQRLANLC